MLEAPELVPPDSDLFRLLVQGVRDYAIFLLSPTGIIMSWNLGAERIKQYTPSDIIGRHFSVFYPAEDLANGKPGWELEEAAKVGSIEDQGWRVRKDGSRFWADVVITALRDEHGVLQGFAKVTRDLTERRRVDEELRRSEERFRLLNESVQNYAIFMLDVEGKVMTWNAGARRIKQYQAEEIIGQSFERFYSAEDVASGKPQRILSTARKLGVVSDEGFRVRKDGSLFFAHVVITAVHDAQGTLRGFAKVTRDLTEQRQAEEEKQRLIQTEEALRLRDEFLSIASHELKTPLTGLQLRLQTMMRHARKQQTSDHAPPSQSDQREQIDLINKALAQGRRLAALVENLLDVSRITTGRLKLWVESCDLGEVVREASEQLSEAAQAARCELHVEAPKGITGEWDRLRIGQVVTNLVNNALKYGPGRPIAVTLEKTEGGSRLTVRDHGIGIALEDRERIFQRFERAVSAQNFGGLGLGLYVCQQIVDAHGGRLSVTSEPGVLTSFVVELPSRALRGALGRRPTL